MAFNAVVGAYTGLIGAALRQSQSRSQQHLDGQNTIANAPTPFSVSVSSGGVTKLAHKLGRVPEGVTISKNQAPGTVYESQAADAKFVYLTSTSGTAHTVEVLVY